MYSENDWRDYLVHSGVLGMQWYVRMGPPYPLKPEQHSASEKKAGWQKSLPSNRSASVQNKKIYGTKLVMSKEEKEQLEKIRKVFENEKAKHPIKSLVTDLKTGIMQKYLLKLRAKYCEVDSKTGLYLKNKRFSGEDNDIEDDAFIINIKNTTNDIGYNMNCSNCVMAYDLRRRGYEVYAGRLEEGRRVDDMLSFYGNSRNERDAMVLSSKSINASGKKWNNFSSDEKANHIEKMLKNKSHIGERGLLVVTSKDYGGHVLSYEITKEGVTLVEPQRGYTSSVKNYGDWNRFDGEIWACPLDHMEPNYSKMKKEGVII